MPAVPTCPMTWPLSQTTALWDAFLASAELEVAIDTTALEALLSSILDRDDASTVTDVLWPRFVARDHPHANVLEIVAALAVVGRGSARDIVHFLASVATLNLRDHVGPNYDELLVALAAALTGTARFLRRGRLPFEPHLEQHVDAAFLLANKHTSQRLTYGDVWCWLQQTPDCCDSPTAFLARFDVLPHG